MSSLKEGGLPLVSCLREGGWAVSFGCDGVGCSMSICLREGGWDVREVVKEKPMDVSKGREVAHPCLF